MGDIYENITTEFAELCKKLSVGDSLYLDEETKANSPYVITAGSKLTDSYEIFKQDLSYYDVDEAIKTGFVKTNNFSPSEYIAIFDEMFCCLTAFLQGDHYLLTIGRCYYFHDYNITDDQILKCFLICYWTFLRLNFIFFSHFYTDNYVPLIFPQTIKEFRNFRNVDSIEELYNQVIQECMDNRNNEQFSAVAYRINVIYNLSQFMSHLLTSMMEKTTINKINIKVWLGTSLDNMELAEKTMCHGSEEVKNKSGAYTFGFHSLACFLQLTDEYKPLDMLTRKMAYKTISTMLREVLHHLSIMNTENLGLLLLGIAESFSINSISYSNYMCYFLYFSDFRNNISEIFKRMCKNEMEHYFKNNKTLMKFFSSQPFLLSFMEEREIKIFEDAASLVPDLFCIPNYCLGKYVKNFTSYTNMMSECVNNYVGNIPYVKLINILINLLYGSLCLIFFLKTIKENLVSYFEYSFIYRCISKCFDNMTSGLTLLNHYGNNGVVNNIIPERITSFKFFSLLSMSMHHMVEIFLRDKLIKMPELTYTTLTNIYNIRISKLKSNFNLWKDLKNLTTVSDEPSIKTSKEIVDMLNDCVSIIDSQGMKNRFRNHRKVIAKNVIFLNILGSHKIDQIKSFDFSYDKTFFTPKCKFKTSKFSD